MNFSQIKNILLSLLVVVIVSSCYYNEEVPFEPEIEIGEVSFSGKIIPIFNQTCNSSSCHGGGVNPNLSSTNAYRSLIDGNYINLSYPEQSELYLWMTGNKKLPMPVSGPNPTNNAYVLEWIKQGAINN